MSDTEEGPWKITAKDILDGMINYSSARHTSQIEYDDLTNKSKPLVGDLLLTKDGTLGRTAIVDAENVCINQSVALLRFNEKCSVQYAKTLLDTPMYQKQMLDDAGGGTIKHIYITKVDKMFISVPCMKEQERLVLFFYNLDNLITLHQRKCDEVKSLKKYMLQKMFPQNEQKVPEIRFEGFTEAWEQRKLGDILISLQNNTLSRADLSNEAGVAKNVHYGDVLIKFGEVLDVSKEKLPMISDESVLSKYKSSFLQNGDVIVADTAEDSTVGKCSEIVGLNDVVVLSGLHTIPYRPIEKFASGYLGYYLNSSAYHNQLIPLMQGIKVTSISKSAMQDTDIVYPKSVEEQGKIGDYFQSLDHIITLHQRKPISHPNHPTTHTKHKGEEKYVRIRVNDRGKINRTANLRRFPVDIPGGFKN